VVALAGAGGALVLKSVRDAQSAEAAREHARRVAEAERGVGAALERAAALQAEGRRLVDTPAAWRNTLTAARAAAAAAEAFLAAGPATEDLHRQVREQREALDEDEKDCRMAMRLEDTRLLAAPVSFDSTSIVNMFNSAAVEEGYTAAFQEYGLEPGALGAAEAARRLAGRPIREQLLAGLAELAKVADFTEWLRRGPLHRPEQSSAGQWLREVVAAADPVYARCAQRLDGFAQQGDRAALGRYCQEVLAQESFRAWSPQRVDSLATSCDLAGDWEDAERLLQTTRDLHPADFWANFNLATILLPPTDSPRPRAAARYLQVAQVSRPDNAMVLFMLGAALFADGDFGEAVAAFRQALVLDPRLALAHAALGRVSLRLGRTADARASLGKAIELKPDFSEAWAALGEVHWEEDRPEEALAALRRAIALHHASFEAQFASLRKRIVDEIRAAGGEGAAGQVEDLMGRMVARWPDPAKDHCRLGEWLNWLGRVDEAADACREALRLKPDLAEAHYQLGDVLRRQGQFAASLDSFQKAHKLGGARPGWSLPSAQEVEYAQLYVAFERRLPAVLAGWDRPKNAAEKTWIAGVCDLKGRTAAAARFFAEALTTDPNLISQRYDAACAAARAGCGDGVDTGRLDGEARARLRRQALDWLRADLAALTQGLATGKPEDRAAIRKGLLRWQLDPNLDCVSGPAVLANLPADERAPWLIFWADVEALRGKAAAPLPPAGDGR
jgi:tetratricopeptide (TPR) repeat protein